MRSFLDVGDLAFDYIKTVINFLKYRVDCGLDPENTYFDNDGCTSTIVFQSDIPAATLVEKAMATFLNIMESLLAMKCYDVFSITQDFWPHTFVLYLNVGVDVRTRLRCLKIVKELLRKGLKLDPSNREYASMAKRLPSDRHHSAKMTQEDVARFLATMQDVVEKLKTRAKGEGAFGIVESEKGKSKKHKKSEKHKKTDKQKSQNRHAVEVASCHDEASVKNGNHKNKQSRKKSKHKRKKDSRKEVTVAISNKGLNESNSNSKKDSSHSESMSIPHNVNAQVLTMKTISSDIANHSHDSIVNRNTLPNIDSIHSRDVQTDQQSHTIKEAGNAVGHVTSLSKPVANTAQPASEESLQEISISKSNSDDSVISIDGTSMPEGGVAHGTSLPEGGVAHGIDKQVGMEDGNGEEPMEQGITSSDENEEDDIILLSDIEPLNNDKNVCAVAIKQENASETPEVMIASRSVSKEDLQGFNLHVDENNVGSRVIDAVKETDQHIRAKDLVSPAVSGAASSSNKRDSQSFSAVSDTRDRCRDTKKTLHASDSSVNVGSPDMFPDLEGTTECDRDVGPDTQPRNSVDAVIVPSQNASVKPTETLQSPVENQESMKSPQDTSNEQPSELNESPPEDLMCTQQFETHSDMASSDEDEVSSAIPISGLQDDAMGTLPFETHSDLEIISSDEDEVPGSIPHSGRESPDSLIGGTQPFASHSDLESDVEVDIDELSDVSREAGEHLYGSLPLAKPSLLHLCKKNGK